MKGKIVLIPFPFTDLAGSKRRPALVLIQSENDVVVAYISSNTSIHNDACLLIGTEHPSFEKTGLKTSSVIRLDKVATLLTDLIVGELGEADVTLRRDINRSLAQIYKI